eukprot:6213701-Pleurochrysis_carterae.AAC.2
MLLAQMSMHARMTNMAGTSSSQMPKTACVGSTSSVSSAGRNGCSATAGAPEGGGGVARRGPQSALSTELRSGAEGSGAKGLGGGGGD